MPRRILGEERLGIPSDDREVARVGAGTAALDRSRPAGHRQSQRRRHRRANGTAAKRTPEPRVLVDLQREVARCAMTHAK
eukprot:10786650-Lingulodinium_polyedra.AAC.1